jgi:FtsP/CotA-like multicopper oxidase with cupredoxin domain
MTQGKLWQVWFSILFICLAALPALGQSYRVQCPAANAQHPRPRCMHLSGGDGFVTMADSTSPTYIFGFSSLCRRGTANNPTGVCTGSTINIGNVNNRGTVSPGIVTSLPGGFQGGQTLNRLVTDPDDIMRLGTLAANESAPTIAVDQDDDFYLTLSNVAMAMRPDLFDGHSVHWHGYAQAASIFDGLPDASIAVIPGAGITYYYKVADEGTYMYHCHVEAAEHMQMGMLGSLYVRPRQNRTGVVGLSSAPAARLGGNASSPVLGYAYNDGDGTTAYDVEYPVQMAGFDPDFHQADLTFQPLPFSAMKDRYFLLNGRSYPETINTAVISTTGPDGVTRASQPIHSLITASRGQRVLLRVSNLSVTQFSTLQSTIPMRVVGIDARLLRAEGSPATNLFYSTNSITIGGGQTVDAILDTANVNPGTYFLYTTNLHHLSNDATNFGGMMTEIRITN